MRRMAQDHAGNVRLVRAEDGDAVRTRQGDRRPRRKRLLPRTRGRRWASTATGFVSAGRQGRTAHMIARRPPVVLLRSRAASGRACAFVKLRPGQPGAGRQTAGTEGTVVGDRQQSGCRRRRRAGGGSSILLLAGRGGRVAAITLDRRRRCVGGREERRHPPLRGGVHRPVLERRGERCGCRLPHGGTSCRRK